MAKILINGRFLRHSSHNASTPDFAECLAMNGSDGRILHVGSTRDDVVQDLITSGAEVLDMQGRLIVPGFIDAHTHLLQTGETLRKLSLIHCETLEAIRETIQRYAKLHPDLRRILCCNWFQSSTQGVALAGMIDDLDPRPIYIGSYDAHSMWCNTAALDELKVAEMEDPPGGRIHRAEDGRPTGLLSETAAFGLALPFLGQQTTIDEKLDFIHDAMTAYITSGYTGLVDMAMVDDTLDVLLKYRAKCGGSLPIWVAMHWLIMPQKTTQANLEQVKRAIQLKSEFDMSTTPDCRIAGIKVMCDGVVDSCTASLVAPYSHNGESPPTIWTAEQLAPVLKMADDAGMQIAIHAIGDAAIKLALDGLEAVGNPAGRHRIEHLETCAPEDVPRLGRLGITASVQPVHSDPFNLQSWQMLLGPTRCGHVFPYNAFAEHGAVVALGTDAPTASHLPLPNLYNATTRRSSHKPEMSETTTPKYALSLAAAITAATQGAAYSCFADSQTGRLERGKMANLTVLDMDWEPANLMRGKVVETWYQGRKVFG